MSAIRLYVLSSLAERGPLHGHALVALAEQEHVSEWADVSTGALYGALKRMLAEGLVAIERTEREGNYPERQVYRITTAGVEAMTAIREGIFRAVRLSTDPFDLALSRLDPDRIDGLAAGLRERRDALRLRLEDAREHFQEIGERYLWLAERLAWDHRIRRLETEVAWHDDLLSQVEDIIVDERERRRRKGERV
ncbi:MAG: PadR family transcriptional regulator [Microbacteriaceae bacterium]